MRALALLLASPCVSAATLELSVHPDASFEIVLNGRPWLAGGEVQIGKLSSSAGTLVLVGAATTSTGTDALGAFNATTFAWASMADAASPLMHTSFRTYEADPGVITFEQMFPSGLNLSAMGAQAPMRVASRPRRESGASYVATDGPSASTLFPGFARGGGAASDKRPCFAYHGVFPQLEACTVGTYAETHQGGSPLVMYEPDAEGVPTTVFSQLTSPKAQHLSTSATAFGAGVKATAAYVDGGWRAMTVLSAAEGVSAGMMAWGDRMLRWSGKPRADMYRDVTHSSIGFWTDNGGFYHYATGNASETYEDVLPKVKASHEAAGVRFRHWQFDSWFYPKDGKVDPGGGGGGVVNWTAMASVFPSEAARPHYGGMAAIADKLGHVPMVMHNRQWSPTSDYVRNLPFTWQVGPQWAIADDPHAFFGWFFQQQRGWGLVMYEQDWMCTEYDGVGALQANLTLADTWLQGMAHGAAANGLSIQYCMPYANDVLAGSQHAAVTNARATGDYFHAAHQWAIGGTAMLYHSLGILPFKDGFYSSSAPQVGGQTVGPETHPDREALMSVLSTAMVGPMDGIGLLNASRVNATCRADGIVLKPDRPVFPADACFAARDPGCFTYHTYTDVPNLGRVHYHFANDASQPLTLPMLSLPLRGSAAPPPPAAVYNWYTGEASLLRPSNPLRAGYEGTVYAVVVPLVGPADLPAKWAPLGQVDKYVPLSRKRVVRVESVGSTKLTMVVEGVSGETVRLCALYFDGSETLDRLCQPVAFAHDGQQTVTISR